MHEEITEDTHVVPVSEQEAATAPHEDSSGGGHAIVLAPEVIGHIQNFPITNTLLVSWITMVILIITALVIRFNLKTIPGKFQNLLEIVIDTGFQTVKDLAHSRAGLFFPIVMTFFLYILVANWLGLFPGFATVGFYDTTDHGRVFVPLLRSINSDLNMTLGLALLSVVITHIFAIKFLGLKDYLKKWFSLEMFGVFLFVGLLELVGEFTKIVSLSFRLFGNIFAGEVVLATISNIFAFIVPLPFYFLELIVGFVQAAVFMMLTLVFMVLLSEKHESH